MRSNTVKSYTPVFGCQSASDAYTVTALIGMELWRGLPSGRLPGGTEPQKRGNGLPLMCTSGVPPTLATVADIGRSKPRSSAIAASSSTMPDIFSPERIYIEFDSKANAYLPGAAERGISVANSSCHIPPSILETADGPRTNSSCHASFPVSAPFFISSRRENSPSGAGPLKQYRNFSGIPPQTFDVSGPPPRFS